MAPNLPGGWTAVIGQPVLFVQLDGGTDIHIAHAVAIGNKKIFIFFPRRG